MAPRTRRIGLSWLALAGCGSATSDASEDGSESSTAASITVADDAGPTTSADSSGGASLDTGDASTGTSVDESGSTADSTGTPGETTPVFVALGDGGWTASSCDRGQSWVTHAFSDEAGDHTQWTAFGGLAYANGAFIAGLGWGGEGGHILHSLDGRTWDDLPASSFVDDGMEIGYAIYTSGVASIGTELMVFSQRVWRSPNGVDFTTTDVSLPPGAEQLRQLRGFADVGVLVASVESQSGNQHPQGHFVVVSDDAGASWTEGTGYVSGCSDPIQHWGDIELVGDVLLVGTGDVCRSPDRGATWELVASPTGAEIHDLSHDDAGFLAVSGSRVFRSDDGSAWNEIGDVGVPLRAAAWADGSYAAVASNGSSLWWSDDATTWTQGTVDAVPQGDIAVRDFLGVVVQGTCERG